MSRRVSVRPLSGKRRGRGVCEALGRRARRQPTTAQCCKAAAPLSKRRARTSAAGRARSSQPIMWKADGNVCQMFQLVVASLYFSAASFQHCPTERSQATVGYRRGYLVWDAAMSRGTCLRVNSRGALWILSAVVFAVNVVDVDAYSCHEVKTAFQLRQVGPLHRVPETPGTGEPRSLAPVPRSTLPQTHCTRRHLSSYICINDSKSR